MALFSKCFADMDSSPTKTLLCVDRAKLNIEPYYHIAFDKRPYEELAYAAVKAEFDPRVVEKDCRYEHLPYTV